MNVGVMDQSRKKYTVAEDTRFPSFFPATAHTLKYERSNNNSTKKISDFHVFFHDFKVFWRGRGTLVQNANIHYE